LEDGGGWFARGGTVDETSCGGDLWRRIRREEVVEVDFCVGLEMSWMKMGSLVVERMMERSHSSSQRGQVGLLCVEGTVALKVRGEGMFEERQRFRSIVKLV